MREEWNDRHRIPINKLQSLVIDMPQKTNRGYQVNIVINGLRVGKWISKVEYSAEANGWPEVVLYGMLSRLDDERKKSWGIE